MTDPYVPATLDELEELLDERILVEDHFVDFKKDLERGPGANKGLAKDLAAFSIDGGRIFIGVDELARDSGNPPVVAAVNLSGLKERIDQIARTSVDPPVGVHCTEIHSDDDSSKGVLVVTIPSSAEPPHTADGRARGLSDTANYVLSSAEVTPSTNDGREPRNGRSRSSTLRSNATPPPTTCNTSVTSSSSRSRSAPDPRCSSRRSPTSRWTNGSTERSSTRPKTIAAQTSRTPATDRGAATGGRRTTTASRRTARPDRTESIRSPPAPRDPPTRTPYLRTTHIPTPGSSAPGRRAPRIGHLWG